MSALKKTFAGLAVVALPFLGGKALAQSGTAVAYNDASKPDTEVKANPASFITQGHAGNAEAFSGKNKVIAIWLPGGTEEKYTAEKYASMIGGMFKDPARTNGFPADVQFFIQENLGKYAAAVVYINGKEVDWNGGEYNDGDELIHPYKLVPEIPAIALRYAKEKGIAVAAPIPETPEEPTVLAKN